jgi:hypothetical protein
MNQDLQPLSLFIIKNLDFMQHNKMKSMSFMTFYKYGFEIQVFELNENALFDDDEYSLF